MPASTVPWRWIAPVRARDYGGYEGKTTPEIRAELGRPWTLWEDGTVPGASPGETLTEVAARVDRVLAQVTVRLADGDVALVAHGHVLRVLTARWLGLPPEAGRLFGMDTATLNILGYEREQRVIRLWNFRESFCGRSNR